MQTPLTVPPVEGLPVAQAAVAYATTGWHIFPCQASDYDPNKKSWAKKPHPILRDEEAERGAGGWKLASNDPERVAAWWKRDPNALIGLPPGLTGAAALDADGAAGIKAIYDKAVDLDLSSTVTSRTPGKGGGMHIWYDRRHITGIIGNGSLHGVPGEARGDRGYIIAPPSVLPDGGAYRFVGDTNLLAPLPTWASDLLPWEKTGSIRASIADITRGDELEWIAARSAAQHDPEAQRLIDQAIAAIKGATPGHQQQGRHPTAVHHAASLITKAQKRLIDIDLATALEELRDALLTVKPGGGPDYDRFISDAIAVRVAEDNARAASTIDPATLTLAREEQDPWTDPETLTPTTANPTPFPTDTLPDKMRRFVEEIARAAQMSETLPALAALGTVSAATANGFLVSINPGWTESLSLYLVGVADPSERKTAALRPSINAILHAATTWTAGTDRSRRELAVRRDGLEARLKEAKKLVGTPEGDREILAVQADLDDLTRDEQALLIPDQIIHDDPTQEALGAAMARQHGVGFVISDEGAFISNLAGRYSQADRIDLSLVNKAYSRSYYHAERTGRDPARIAHPHLALVLFVQPRIAEQFARPDFEDSGFLSRVLYANPPSIVGARSTSVTSFSPLYTIAIDAWKTIISDIFQRGWGRTDDPHILTLTPGAIAVFEPWWTLCEKRAIGDAWWGKAHGNTIRLAAILTLAEDPYARTIDAAHLESAITLMEYFGDEHNRMRTLYIDGDGYTTELSKNLRRLLSHIARRWNKIDHQAGIRLRDMTNWMHARKDETELLAAQLVDLGWLREGTGRRGEIIYQPHPSIPAAAELDFQGHLKGASSRLPEQALLEESGSELSRFDGTVAVLSRSLSRSSNPVDNSYNPRSEGVPPVDNLETVAVVAGGGPLPGQTDVSKGIFSSSVVFSDVVTQVDTPSTPLSPKTDEAGTTPTPPRQPRQNHENPRSEPVSGPRQSPRQNRDSATVTPGSEVLAGLPRCPTCQALLLHNPLDLEEPLYCKNGCV